jgi:hypothetical protein
MSGCNSPAPLSSRGPYSPEQVLGTTRIHAIAQTQRADSAGEADSQPFFHALTLGQHRNPLLLRRFGLCRGETHAVR